RNRAQRSKGPWILLCCLLVLGGLASLFIVRGLRIHDLRQQLATSQLDYQQAWIDRDELEDRLASKDDLSAIEEAARQQLGWVLPGEERVIFIRRTDESSSEGE
ncbi:septum formation initiator family protein, partial [Candidatus Bipolaricaulota bacterium]|nr:septum formation initiator family protein [Candidatus Bipolaricaulota bacterium]